MHTADGPVFVLSDLICERVSAVYGGHVENKLAERFEWECKDDVISYE
jgi:hypothetical protein